MVSQELLNQAAAVQQQQQQIQSQRGEILQAKQQIDSFNPSISLTVQQQRQQGVTQMNQLRQAEATRTQEKAQAQQAVQKASTEFEAQAGPAEAKLRNYQDQISRVMQQEQDAEDYSNTPEGRAELNQRVTDKLARIAFNKSYSDVGVAPWIENSNVVGVIKDGVKISLGVIGGMPELKQGLLNTGAITETISYTTQTETNFLPSENLKTPYTTTTSPYYTPNTIIGPLSGRATNVNVPNPDLKGSPYYIPSRGLEVNQRVSSLPAPELKLEVFEPTKKYVIEPYANLLEKGYAIIFPGRPKEEAIARFERAIKFSPAQKEMYTPEQKAALVKEAIIPYQIQMAAGGNLAAVQYESQYNAKRAEILSRPSGIFSPLAKADEVGRSILSNFYKVDTPAQQKERLDRLPNVNFLTYHNIPFVGIPGRPNSALMKYATLSNFAEFSYNTATAPLQKPATFLVSAGAGFAAARFLEPIAAAGTPVISKIAAAINSNAIKGGLGTLYLGSTGYRVLTNPRPFAEAGLIAGSEITPGLIGSIYGSKSLAAKKLVDSKIQESDFTSQSEAQKVIADNKQIELIKTKREYIIKTDNPEVKFRVREQRSVMARDGADYYGGGKYEIQSIIKGKVQSATYPGVSREVLTRGGETLIQAQFQVQNVKGQYQIIETFERIMPSGQTKYFSADVKSLSIVKSTGEFGNVENPLNLVSTTAPGRERVMSYISRSTTSKTTPLTMGFNNEKLTPELFYSLIKNRPIGGVSTSSSLEVPENLFVSTDKTASRLSITTSELGSSRSATRDITGDWLPIEEFMKRIPGAKKDILLGDLVSSPIKPTPAPAVTNVFPKGTYAPKEDFSSFTLTGGRQHIATVGMQGSLESNYPALSSTGRAVTSLIPTLGQYAGITMKTDIPLIIPKFNTAQTTTLSTATGLVNSLVTPVEKVQLVEQTKISTLTAQVPIMDVTSITALREVTALQPAQIQLNLQVLKTTQYTPTIPQVILPIIPPVKPTIYNISPDESKKLRGLNLLRRKAYQAQVRRGGKFFNIGTPTSLSKALRAGSNVALGTLAATFRAIPLKSTTTEEDIQFRPNPYVFRSPKNNAALTFIQRAGGREGGPGRLASFGERSEIKQYQFNKARATKLKSSRFDILKARSMF